MTFGFSYIGLIWLLMLFIPNFIWTKNQPKDYEKYAAKENKLLLALERSGEFIVTPLALIFSDFNFKGWNFWFSVLLLSFLCMLLYEIYWIRYFKSEKTMKDFYRGILGIPVAGASLPVIAFFLLGIYGGNILMILASFILGVGHIGIHLQHKKEVYEAPPKRKPAARITLAILKGLLITLAVIICGSFTFFIAGRNINQFKRALSYKDGLNEQLYLQLTDQEEYITITGKSEDNPIIISLHGGPGAPTTYMDYCYQDYLTDDFTVVCWDERGCGRSYYPNAALDPDNKSLTFDQQLSDLNALVDYLCQRFNKKQVIILGHSYGSMLGSRYALSYPEKVSTYIGVGQCVNEKNYAGEVYSYEDALKLALDRGDDTTALESAYKNFISDLSLQNLFTLRKLVSPYHPQTVTKDLSVFAALTSPIAGIDDMRWYFMQLFNMDHFIELISPLEGYMNSFNALETADKYQMPVLLISGSCDWICPVDFVIDYAQSLTAPKVKLELIEGCGHSPQVQLPEEVSLVIKDFLTTSSPKR
jgi:pimeloyl-ACP methyl ester carboxylesterase